MATLAFVLETLGATLRLFTGFVTLTVDNLVVAAVPDNEFYENYQAIERHFCSIYPQLVREPWSSYLDFKNLDCLGEMRTAGLNIFQAISHVNETKQIRGGTDIRQYKTIEEYFVDGQLPAALKGFSGLIFQNAVTARDYFRNGKVFLPMGASLSEGSTVIMLSASPVDEFIRITQDIIDGGDWTHDVEVCGRPLRTPKIPGLTDYPSGLAETCPPLEQLFEEADVVVEHTDYTVDQAAAEFAYYWNRSCEDAEFKKLMSRGLVTGIHMGRNAARRIWRQLPRKALLEDYIIKALAIVEESLTTGSKGYLGVITLLLARKQSLILCDGYLEKKN